MLTINKMRVFIVFLVCGFFVIISSRPTVEGNGSETSDAEYEGSDDSMQDEYLNEDQESGSDEAERTVNQERIQQEPQEFKHNIPEERIDQSRARYKLSDPEFDDGKEPRQDQINLNVVNENEFSVQSGFPKTYHKEAQANEELHENQRFDRRDMNIQRGSNHPDDAFIKMNREHLKIDRRDYNNEHLDSNEGPSSIKQYYSTSQTRNKDYIVDRKKYDNSCNTRDRREIENINRENNEDINESSEISILKNIKMLSDKDLENLLNSLPEDKKALLRKIMDKREITKKAGAVDDNGLDTSKLEGSYSIDSNAVSSLSTNTEASNSIKHSESEESSTKPQENENDTRKSENKAGLNANTNEQVLELSIEAVTSNTDTKNDASIVNKETSKNDNKREIKLDLDKKDELLENTKFGVDLNDKRSFDSFTDHDHDNNDCLDSETDGSNTQKREVLQDNSLANADSIKSLEDSFPSAYGYEDINLNSEPLIRVKRTELKHIVKKRDLPPLVNDKVPFVPVFEDKEPENVEVSEFEDKSFLNNANVNVRDDRQIKPHKDPNLDRITLLRLKSGLNDNSGLGNVETDESSIGSDTDSILSNDEEVGDNVMYNCKIRNKRLNENIKDEKNNEYLIRSGRTITPIENENNLKQDNSIDTPQYQGEESFGTHSSEEEFSRSKRIKRVKS